MIDVVFSGSFTGKRFIRVRRAFFTFYFISDDRNMEGDRQQMIGPMELVKQTLIIAIRLKNLEETSHDEQFIIRTIYSHDEGIKSVCYVLGTSEYAQQDHMNYTYKSVKE